MNDLEGLLYLLPIVLASLTLHELAHAFVAWRLGDPTAKSEGRLTLNPIAHLDPFGAAMFVLTYVLANFPFGWAKPVPVDPRNFRRPKEGMALVGAAGPFTNFMLALVCIAALAHIGMSERAHDALELAYFVNVILGLFNLLPIPPLDGSRIVGALMPDAAYARWISLDQVGMLVLFGVIFLFQREFFLLFGTVLDQSTEAFVTIVGG